MKIKVPVNIIVLSLAFLLIFLGFNGTQQYVTSFFASKGIAEVGFQSLLLVYLFFILANPVAAWVVGKCGQKPAMIAGSTSYVAYIFALALENVTFLYFASVILGIGASLLWTGQISYLLRTSRVKSSGENSGFFQTIFFLGSAIGIFGIGFLISRFSFQTSFLLAITAPIAGLLLLMALPSLPKEQQKNQLMLIKKAVRSITVLRFAGIWLAVNFVFGSVIGVLPLQIKQTIGLEYVGILTSLFYVFPIIFALFIGRMSDRFGRSPMIVAAYSLIISGFFLLVLPTTPALLLGTVLLAAARACTVPLLPALAGDLGNKENLESLIAVFWMAQNLGVVLNLFLGRILNGQIVPVYITGLILAIASFSLVIPVLRKGREVLCAKIANEVQ